MHARYSGFERLIGIWDFYLVMHPVIRDDLVEGSSINPSMVEVVYPKCQNIENFTSSPRHEKLLLHTGALTDYRKEMIFQIEKAVAQKGWKFQDCGFKDDESIFKTAVGSISIPQNAHWPYSSPNRIQRAISRGLLPITMIEDKMHPINAVAVTLSDVLERDINTVGELRKQVVTQAELYNRFAEQNSARLVTKIDEICDRRFSINDEDRIATQFSQFRRAPVLLNSNHFWRLYKLDTILFLVFYDLTFSRDEADDMLENRHDEKVIRVKSISEAALVMQSMELPKTTSSHVGIDTPVGALVHEANGTVVLIPRAHSEKKSIFPNFFLALDYIVERCLYKFQAPITVLESEGIKLIFDLDGFVTCPAGAEYKPVIKNKNKKETQVPSVSKFFLDPNFISTSVFYHFTPIDMSGSHPDGVT